MASSSKRMVTLRSSDGMTREVEESAAARSSIIRDMIRDVPSGKIIDIPNVSGEILYIVLDYCVAAPLVPLEEVQAWKSRLSQLDESTLRDLDKAAQSLVLGRLRDLISETLEDRTQEASRLSNSPASTNSISSTRMVNLQCSDGEILEVEESVAVRSRTLRKMIEDDPSVNTIDIPNVSREILSKALEYCAAVPTSRPHLKETNEAWKAQLSQDDESTLRDLDKAADYLALDDLKDVISQTLKKDMPTGTAVQETRKKTHIEKYPLELSFGKKPTEEEVSDLWKKSRIVNDPPKEKDFSIPKDPLELKLGTESTEQEHSIVNDPLKEIDFGKESPEFTQSGRE